MVRLVLLPASEVALYYGDKGKAIWEKSHLQYTHTNTIGSTLYYIVWEAERITFGAPEDTCLADVEVVDLYLKIMLDTRINMEIIEFG